MPSVDVVLRGFSLTSSEGNFAPCAVYLVRAADAGGAPRTLIYDTAHAGRRMKLTAALGRRGMDPAEVDTVVLSHAHWDHVQNTDLFPNARVLVHEAELSYAAAPHRADHATPRWTAALLAASRAEPCADGDELYPGVRVLHLPGHTPGSVGLAVQTGDGLAVVSGDALANAADAARRQCPNVFWDVAQADESIRRVMALASAVYPGHDRPFQLGRDGPAGYLAEIRPVTLGVGSLRPDDVTIAAHERSARRLFGRAAQDAAGPGS